MSRIGDLMDKKAFTLVELLVVIVIIGLISYLSFPALMRVITDTNAKKEFEYFGQTMVDAAKIYIKKEAVDLHEAGAFNGKTVNVGFNQLETDEYVSEPTFTKKGMSCDLDNAFVRVKYSSPNGYKFSYNLECKDVSTKKKYTKKATDKEFTINDLN